MGNRSFLFRTNFITITSYLIGKQKRILSGFSASAIFPHAGYIYYHPIVQSLPPNLRRKAARIIAAKCTLAVRADAQHEKTDGSSGEQFSGIIKLKLKKLLEPPPVKANKALPKPLEKASKKRGGKRVRKQKERMGLTELRKKQNRMTFGEIKEDVVQNLVGFSLGQASSGSSRLGGRIRASVVDNKTRVRLESPPTPYKYFGFLILEYLGNFRK